jgi:hypothetical protein
MWIPFFSALLQSRPQHRSIPQKRASVRLSVEALEGRLVPSSVTVGTVPELVAAINTANASPDADTITLEAGNTFTLTDVNNTMHGQTGTPMIGPDSGGMTIVGNGDTIERRAETPFITWTPYFRLFDVAIGATLTLQNLTLQGGRVVGNQQTASGGAVFSQGSLTLNTVTVQNNSVLGGAGGGLYSSGALTMTGVTLQNNIAEGESGFGKTQSAGDAEGGGLYSLGALTMTGCTIQHNSALGGAGVEGANGGDAFGGGIYIGGGKATITNSFVTANSARGGAAGLRQIGDPDKNYGGHAGQGIGGGIDIDGSALVSLDGFTKDQVLNNFASSSKSNIAGSYKLLP